MIPKIDTQISLLLNWHIQKAIQSAIWPQQQLLVAFPQRLLDCHRKSRPSLQTKRKLVLEIKAKQWLIQLQIICAESPLFQDTESRSTNSSIYALFDLRPSPGCGCAEDGEDAGAGTCRLSGHTSIYPSHEIVRWSSVPRSRTCRSPFFYLYRSDHAN